MSRQFRRIRVGVNVFFSHRSDLIFPPIRVRVNHYIGTALVPMSRQFSLIRVGVHVFSFHRSELGLTTTLEQLLFQCLGNFLRSELGFTHVFPPIRVRVDHCIETVFVLTSRQFPLTALVSTSRQWHFLPPIVVEVDRHIETVFISMSRQFLLDP